jgi:hypothetical protein
VVRGGHSPRWTAEPEKIVKITKIKVNNNTLRPSGYSVTVYITPSKTFQTALSQIYSLEAMSKLTSED